MRSSNCKRLLAILFLSGDFVTYSKSVSWCFKRWFGNPFEIPFGPCRLINFAWLLSTSLTKSLAFEIRLYVDFISPLKSLLFAKTLYFSIEMYVFLFLLLLLRTSVLKFSIIWSRHVSINHQWAFLPVTDDLRLKGRVRIRWTSGTPLVFVILTCSQFFFTFFAIQSFILHTSLFKFFLCSLWVSRTPVTWYILINYVYVI